MEASGAGLAAAPAAGDGGAAADGGDAAQQQAAQNGQPDVSTALESITKMLADQREFLDSEPWKPPAVETPEEEAAPPDLSFLDDSQPGYTQEQAAAGLQQLVSELAQQQAQEIVAPLAKQQQEMQVRQETDDLIGRFPQMADENVSKQVIDTARQWADMLGHPELAASPAVWEMVYLAGRAADQANQETAANGGGAATLEGAGGASPGGSGQGDVPTAQSITKSWSGGSLPLFGTKR